MTDKEIIIDGVDVSEWTDEEVRYKFEKHSPKAIRQIAFDLYKQLKRKEQELKNICKAFDIEYAIYEETGNLIGRCNKLYKKEQECEELKHKVELMMDCASCKNDEYEQTLIEIKEIAEKEVKRAPDGETFARPEIKQILQKINECEGKNEN